MYELIKDFYPINISAKQRLESKGILIAMSSNFKIHFLNETSNFFIQYADGNHTIDQIREIMQTEYNVPKDILCKDLCSLVRELQWRHLISLEPRTNL